MGNTHLTVCLPQARLQLHGTAGVGGGDDGRAGADEVGEFAVEQLLRHLRLGDVVDARAAAAPVRFRQLHKIQARNHPQQIARRLGNLLAVAKVAGLVIGHALDVRRRRRMLQSDFREPLVDVLQLLRPQLRAGGERGVVVQQVGVVFQVRAAAAGVADDGRRSVMHRRNPLLVPIDESTNG